MCAEVGAIKNKLPEHIQYLPPSNFIEHGESHRIPEMSSDEWTDFFESVRSRNQIIEPLSALPDGRVYDGRHRLRAAKELNLRLIPVIFYDISEDDALQRMSESAVLRRSLLPGQRAAITLEFAEMVDELRRKAKERQLSGLKQGNEIPVSADLQERGSKNEVMEQLAEKVGTSARNMYTLQAVQRDAPELFEKVKSGEITINKAYTEKKNREVVKESTPKKPSKSAKDRLNTVIKNVGTEKLELPTGRSENTLDSTGIILDHANVRIPQFVMEYVHNYDLLPQVDSEVLQAYTKQLRSVAEGTLLLLEEFEVDEKRRLFFEVISKIFLMSKDDTKLDEFIKNIGGLLNEEE